MDTKMSDNYGTGALRGCIGAPTAVGGTQIIGMGEGEIGSGRLFCPI